MEMKTFPTRKRERQAVRTNGGARRGREVQVDMRGSQEAVSEVGWPFRKRLWGERTHTFARTHLQS